MYWDDFRSLVRRNEAPNATVRFSYNAEADPNSITVHDYKLLRRKPKLLQEMGSSQHDYWRDSLVCRAAFFGGEIPMESNLIVGSEFKEGVYRGALGVLETLIREGCLRRTDELRHLFARHKRRLPTP